MLEIGGGRCAGDGLPNDTKSRQYSYASQFGRKLDIIIIIIIIVCQRINFKNDSFRFYNKIFTNRNASNYLFGAPNGNGLLGRGKSGFEERVIRVNKYGVKMWNGFV